MAMEGREADVPIRFRIPSLAFCTLLCGWGGPFTQPGPMGSLGLCQKALSGGYSLQLLVTTTHSLAPSGLQVVESPGVVRLG